MAGILAQLRLLLSKLRWRLRQLLPKVESYYVLGRAIEDATAPSLPEAVSRVSWVRSENDPDAAALFDFSTRQQGMDEQWCRQELGRGLSMVLAWASRAEAPSSPQPAACNLSQRVGNLQPECIAAVGWIAFGRHRVDDILQDLDPGPNGCHLLNVFVDPGFRGMGLQRLLSLHRMAYAASLAKRFAYTVVNVRNKPSLANNYRAGFGRLLRVDVIRIVGRTVLSMRRLSRAVPDATLSGPGWSGSQWLRMV